MGLTGEVKFMTRVGGFVLFTCAVKWIAALPMNIVATLRENLSGPATTAA